MGTRRWIAWCAVGALVAGVSGCGDDEMRTFDVVATPTAPVTTSTVPVMTSTAPVATPTASNPTDTVTPTSSATVGSPATATRTPTPTPTATNPPIEAARFVGVYDASENGATRFIPGDWIGAVREMNDAVTIGIYFDGHSSVWVQGGLRGNGSVDLVGDGQFEDDIRFLPEGSAFFGEADGMQRIRGEIHDRTSLGFQTSFQLQRPIAGTPSRFGGAYRFLFDPSPSGCQCPTSATLTIEIGDDGFGRSSVEAAELAADEAQLGTFHAGNCLVTASGRLRCDLFYETTFVAPPGTFRAGPSFFVTLTGQLHLSGATASGSGVSSAIIFPSPYFLGGNWTAARQP